MRLDKILREHGIEMSANSFHDLIEVTLFDQYPNWNDEELTCNPKHALLYCADIRRKVYSFTLPDREILRALGKRRKAGRGTMLGKRVPRLNLKTQLEEHGCGLETNAFRDILTDMLFSLYPDWNDEELCCNPRDAIRYCNAVRRRADSPTLPDRVVLRALASARKASARS